MAHDGAACFEFPHRVAGNNTINFGIAKRATRNAFGRDNEKSANVWAFDDGGKCDRRIVADMRRENLVCVHVTTQEAE